MQFNEKNEKIISLQVLCEKEREKLKTEIANSKVVSALKQIDVEKY